jgi:hypothetical protein
LIIDYPVGFLPGWDRGNNRFDTATTTVTITTATATTVTTATVTIGCGCVGPVRPHSICTIIDWTRKRSRWGRVLGFTLSVGGLQGGAGKERIGEDVGALLVPSAFRVTQVGGLLGEASQDSVRVGGADRGRQHRHAMIAWPYLDPATFPRPSPGSGLILGAKPSDQAFRSCPDLGTGPRPRTDLDPLDDLVHQFAGYLLCLLVGQVGQVWGK